MRDVFAAMEQAEVVIGHWVSSGSTRMTELIGASGADLVAIDCEHGPLSPYGADLEHCVRSAYAADVFPIVRVPSHDPVQVAKVADAGARGVMIPHVNRPDELRRALDHAKFAPAGNRGCFGSSPAARMGFTPWAEVVADANAHVEVIPMFEEPRAFEVLDELLAVDGLRAVAIGPIDLAARFGGVGDPEAERRVAECRQQLLDACGPRNISVIDGAWDFETFTSRVSEGCRGIMYASDVSLVAGALRAQVPPMRDYLVGR